MKKVEIKECYDMEMKKLKKVLYVGNEMFDWEIDGTEIEKAKQFLTSPGLTGLFITLSKVTSFTPSLPLWEERSHFKN